MDYVRRLVALRYLDEAAVAIVHSRRDAPNVGIGLRPAAARPQQAQAAPQQGQQQAAAAAPVGCGMLSTDNTDVGMVRNGCGRVSRLELLRDWTW